MKQIAEEKNKRLFRNLISDQKSALVSPPSREYWMIYRWHCMICLPPPPPPQSPSVRSTDDTQEDWERETIWLERGEGEEEQNRTTKPGPLENIQYSRPPSHPLASWFMAHINDDVTISSTSRIFPSFRILSITLWQNPFKFSLGSRFLCNCQSVHVRLNALDCFLWKAVCCTMPEI
jgi:hypothetical protein